MSIRIIKSTNNDTGVVTLIKKIEGNDGNGPYKFEVTITDPEEYAFYTAELAKIDGGDSEAGRLA